MTGRVLSGAVLIALVCVQCMWPNAAHAEDRLPDCLVGGDDRVGYGIVLPSQGCDVTWHSDMTFGFFKGDTVDDDWQTMVGFENGALFAVGDTGATFHAGPVLAFGFGAFDDDDAPTEWTLGPRARGRWWLLDGWMTIETAIGPQVSWTRIDHPTLRRSHWDARPGAYFDVGTTLGGGAGLYFAADYAHGHEPEIRAHIGMRSTLVLSALLALVGGATYLRAQ